VAGLDGVAAHRFDVQNERLPGSLRPGRIGGCGISE
jgi:hypothetical protein